MLKKHSQFVVCMDSFKGCLTSHEANEAVQRGVRQVLPDAEVIAIPVSDGGEGFVEACRHVYGGMLHSVQTCDALLRDIEANYLVCGYTAIIEVAKIIGLAMLAEEERNPMRASSYGVGTVVADAIQNGAKHIIVGLGGSATSDSGTGMLRALCDVFAPEGTWRDIKVFDGIKFTIATDVNNPLCGKNGATYTFAPQKGATPDMLCQLEKRALDFATRSAHYFGYDRSNAPGAGAAGGLGYAFMQYLNATCESGAAMLLDATHFDTLLPQTDCIFTGEGTANRQTLMGKLPYTIMAS